MKKIGFIGAGNMAGAIIGGIVKSNLVKSENVIASAKTMANLERLQQEYNINVTLDSKEVVKNSDIVFMAVKPNIFDGVLEGVADLIDDKKIIVSIAAGKSIEAMADAAVMAGMPRKQAYNFAAQSVLGSAKMVLESGKHPGELKDMVCSPAGTTIDAVKVLENEGMRSAVINAVCACVEKSRKMSK